MMHAILKQKLLLRATDPQQLAQTNSASLQLISNALAAIAIASSTLNESATEALYHQLETILDSIHNKETV